MKQSGQTDRQTHTEHYNIDLATHLLSLFPVQSDRKSVRDLYKRTIYTLSFESWTITLIKRFTVNILSTCWFTEMNTTTDQLYPDIWRKMFEYFNTIELLFSLMYLTKWADEVLFSKNYRCSLRRLDVDSYVLKFFRENFRTTR